ncbi:MAG TPA: hypothetical protein VIV58_37155 [Kofleriaceae bacterium]
MRDAALDALKALYVHCDVEAGCTTDPEVARAVIPYARQAVASPQIELRVTGVQVIALLGELGMFAELEHALRDAHVAVRVAALEALHEFGALAAPFAALARDRLAGAANAEEAAAAASLLHNLAPEAGDDSAG